MNRPQPSIADGFIDGQPADERPAIVHLITSAIGVETHDAHGRDPGKRGESDLAFAQRQLGRMQDVGHRSKTKVRTTKTTCAGASLSALLWNDGNRLHGKFDRFYTAPFPFSLKQAITRGAISSISR
jgi:hypothetical protein